VRFLTRAFRNGLYVRVGKLNCSLVAFAALTNSCTRPAGMQTELQLEAATYAGVILPATGQFPLLCLL